MRFLDFIVLVILIASLTSASLFLWYNLPPTESVLFEYYAANLSKSEPAKSTQFYPNMRYPAKEISYSIESACSKNKREDVTKAFRILEEKTVLSFYEVDKGQIRVLCSQKAPEPEDRNHFVAGEGGPTEIINTTNYAVILAGRISLYREEKCASPQIATHEILHALGFDHNSKSSSIMNPVTNCNQIIDDYIIEDISQIYSVPPITDLAIEKITANKTGKYLNFQAIITNEGLKESQNSTLEVVIEGEVIESFRLEQFEIGSTKYLTITNLKIPSSTEKVELIVQTPEVELSKTNNKVSIRAVK